LVALGKCSNVSASPPTTNMLMDEIELRVKEILCVQFAFKKTHSFTFCVIAIESVFKLFALKHLMP
jgi:hypothetical protein